VAVFLSDLAADPFRQLKLTPDMRLCVVFSADTIRGGLQLPLFSPRKDIQILQARQHEACVVWYIRYGRPPSSQGFLEEALGKRTTTRFFHTAGKILMAAKGG
jgi:hypothetical protein